MTEIASRLLDIAVFCRQSSVLPTVIRATDTNCVRFPSRSPLLAIALAPPVKNDCITQHRAYNGQFVVTRLHGGIGLCGQRP